MRKLMTLSILLIGLSSCENRIADTPLIVKEIKTYNNKICRYYVYSTFKSDLNSFNRENASFLDSCSKFNVGDTLKIIKQ